MSQGSPSKHDRVERHLMRSRGAGARTIETDFGFSFAFSSLTSASRPAPSPHAVVARKPQPKTENTSGRESFEDGEVSAAVGELPERSAQEVPFGGTKPVSGKPTKLRQQSRRRICKDDGDYARPSTQESDSPFIKANSKAKTTRERATQKTVPILECETTETSWGAFAPSDKTRARRKTAVAASAKIVEGSNGDTSVDKNRQETAPRPASRRSRKKQSATDDRLRLLPVTGVNSEEVYDQVPLSETQQNAGSNAAKDTPARNARQPRRKPTTKRTKASVLKVPQPSDISESGRRKNEDDSLMSLVAVSETRPRASRLPLLEADANRPLPSISPDKLQKTSPIMIREAKKTTTVRKKKHIEVTDVAPARSTKRRKLRIEPDQRQVQRPGSDGTATLLDELVVALSPVGEDDLAPTQPAAREVDPTTMPWTRRAHTKARPAGEETSPLSHEQSAGIVVVAPQMPNVDRESTAAEKLANPGRKLSNARNENHLKTSMAKSRNTARSKALAKHSERPRHPSPQPSYGKNLNALPSEDRSPDVTAGPGLPVIPISVSSKTIATCQQSRKLKTSSSAEEEDVDWLFAPQEPGRAPKAIGKKAETTAGVGARNKMDFGKLPHIDLDDLVANIGTLVGKGVEKVRSRKKTMTG